MLNAACLLHPRTAAILPFETICPVPWDRVEDFALRDSDLGRGDPPGLRHRHALEPIDAGQTGAVAGPDRGRDRGRRLSSRADHAKGGCDGPGRRRVTLDPAAILLEVDTVFGRIWTFDNDIITNQILQFGAHTRPELAFLLSVIRPGRLRLRSRRPHRHLRHPDGPEDRRRRQAPRRGGQARDLCGAQAEYAGRTPVRRNDVAERPHRPRRPALPGPHAREEHGETRSAGRRRRRHSPRP